MNGNGLEDGEITELQSREYISYIINQSTGRHYGRVVKATDSNLVSRTVRYLFSSEAQVQVLLVSLFAEFSAGFTLYFFAERNEMAGENRLKGSKFLGIGFRGHARQCEHYRCRP